jgi:hypothetical protein
MIVATRLWRDERDHQGSFWFGFGAADEKHRSVLLFRLIASGRAVLRYEITATDGMLMMLLYSAQRFGRMAKRKQK